jgi:hypothetical protein
MNSNEGHYINISLILFIITSFLIGMLNDVKEKIVIKYLRLIGSFLFSYSISMKILFYKNNLIQ